MSTTLKKEIDGVRSFLGDPLDQFPSTKDILDELEAEYQNVSNIANNTGVSWAIDELVFPTVANQFDYCLSDLRSDFYKAAHAEILPEGITLGAEVDGKRTTIDYTNSLKNTKGVLEFTEIERFPYEYQWLQSVGGQLFFNTRYSFYMGFYRQIFQNVGEKQFVRLAPIPTQSDIYIKILYQTTDWWENLFADLSTDTERYLQKLPHSSHRMLFRALVAKNLIYKGKVSWGADKQYNKDMKDSTLKGLEDKIGRYTESFNEYILTLEEPDSVTIDPWDNGEYK